MADYIDLTADILDSRDILERYEELDDRANADESSDLFPPEPLSDEEHDEYATLGDLLQEIRNNAEDTPQAGVALIADSYFEDYAREFAEDIGAVPRDAGWPTSYIDWERAADALKMDYTSIEADGRTFWVR